MPPVDRSSQTRFFYTCLAHPTPTGADGEDATCLNTSHLHLYTPVQVGLPTFLRGVQPVADRAHTRSGQQRTEPILCTSAKLNNVMNPTLSRLTYWGVSSVARKRPNLSNPTKSGVCPVARAPPNELKLPVGDVRPVVHNPTIIPFLCLFGSPNDPGG